MQCFLFLKYSFARKSTMVMVACLSSSITKLAYQVSHSLLRLNARKELVLKSSDVNFRSTSTMPQYGFRDNDTPNHQEWPGESNHVNSNNSLASPANKPSQGTAIDRVHSLSHSTLTNGSSKPIWPTRQRTNYRYTDDANDFSRHKRMPVDAIPTPVSEQRAMRRMLQQQTKYKNYFVASEKLQDAWRAVLLSRHITHRYSALPADSAAAAASASTNSLTAKFERRDADRFSTVMKRLRMVGMPHSMPTLSTLLNTFIHAACLTNTSDRETLHRAHTAAWIAFAEQLHKTVQNLLTSKNHALSSHSDVITVSDLLDSYAALYHMHFPRHFSPQLTVAVDRICSSLDQLAVALLDKMTTSDALQLADWTLLNICYLSSNFNHHFIKRWFSAVEHFSPSAKHAERHAALPSAEECLRVMFQLAIMRGTAPGNLMAVFERLIVGRDARWNSTTNTTDGTTTRLFISVTEQHADHPISLDGMSDTEFAVMCYSFFRTKSYFHDVRTFTRVVQRAGRYVHELSARAATINSADQNYNDTDAELAAAEQQFPYEISVTPSRIEQQQPKYEVASVEPILLNSIVKCILMNANRRNVQILEPFTSMVRRTLTAVGSTRSADLLQSIFTPHILTRIAAITSSIGLRDEVLLDLIFKRILTACRLQPKSVRFKELAQLLEVCAVLTYVPNEGGSNSDEEQFFSFFDNQIGGLVSKRDSEIMAFPELLAQSVWHLTTLGFYSPTMIHNLFALSQQYDISWRGPKNEGEVDYFDSRNSSSRRRRQRATDTGLALLRWCILFERPNFDWRNIFVKPTTDAEAVQNNEQGGVEHASRYISQSLRDDAEDDEVVDSSSSSMLNSLSEMPAQAWLQRVQPSRGAIARRIMYDALCDNINKIKWLSSSSSSDSHDDANNEVARALHLTPYADQSIVLRVDRTSGKPLPFDERVASMFGTAVDASDLQQQQQLSSPTDMNVNLLDGNRHTKHIALIIRNEGHYFESIRGRSRHLLGHWRMQERHLRMMGFHPVSIDHYELLSLQQGNDSTGMNALIRNALRSIQ